MKFSLQEQEDSLAKINEVRALPLCVPELHALYLVVLDAFASNDCHAVNIPSELNQIKSWELKVIESYSIRQADFERQRAIGGRWSADDKASKSSRNWGDWATSAGTLSDGDARGTSGL